MTEATLSGKHVLLVVPATQFRDEEVFGVKGELETAGAEVTVASSAVRVCRGMDGGSIQSEVALDGLTPDSYDAVVLAGGASVPHLFWNDKALLSLVSAAAEAGKVLAAISLSSIVLVRAKLLEGKRATVYYLPEAIEEFRSSGVGYVKDGVVVEGNLITAEGPENVLAFSRAITAALSSAPESAMV